MPALLAIAMISLQSHNRLHQIEHLAIGHIAQRIGGAGKGFFFVMGTAHAATHIDIAALGSTGGIAEQHQADVLGEQIHRVVPRHRYRHLELARQVSGAI